MRERKRESTGVEVVEVEEVKDGGCAISNVWCGMGWMDESC